MSGSTARRSLAFASDSERLRAALRSAQWSVYFERFFGGGRGGSEVPGIYAPLDYEQAARVLEDACQRPLPQVEVAQHRAALRRTVSQMVLAKSGPTGKPPPGFETIVRDAAGGGLDATRAARKLHSLAKRELADEETFRRRSFSLDEALEGQETVSVPSRITHRGDAFSVEKQVYFRQEFDSTVQALVNPLNWTKLGEYFTTTERGDRETTEIDRGPIPWRGVMHEVFTVTWNGYTTQTFDQLLKVDYTVLSDRARTDYLLMYDEDDQITLNEGYFEATEDAAHPGWMSVTMVKTVRFTSSLLNLLAPAILSMVLDSKAGGFKAFVEQGPARPIAAQAR